MTWNHLLSHSYTPYSKQPGGCLVRSRQGRYHPGVRIENLSFPLTIDEVQAALFGCLSEGEEPEQLLVPPGYHSQDPLLARLYGLQAEELNSPEQLELPDNPEMAGIARPVKQDGILQELERCAERAYSPYSDFPVSCLLETVQGYISGVNIECSSWMHGLCAERVALAKMLSHGIGGGIQVIHIHAKSGTFISPCGSCRQVLIEHASQSPVLLYHGNGTRSEYFVSQLLPYQFQTDFLK